MKVGSLVKYEWKVQDDDGQCHTLTDMGVVVDIKTYPEAMIASIEWVEGNNPMWIDCEKLELVNESR